LLAVSSLRYLNTHVNSGFSWTALTVFGFIPVRRYSGWSFWPPSIVGCGCGGSKPPCSSHSRVFGVSHQRPQTRSTDENPSTSPATSQSHPHIPNAKTRCLCCKRGRIPAPRPGSQVACPGFGRFGPSLVSPANPVPFCQDSSIRCWPPVRTKKLSVRKLINTGKFTGPLATFPGFVRLTVSSLQGGWTCRAGSSPNIYQTSQAVQRP